jgi:hypothetical protein
MAEAKLVLTDALITQALRRSKHGERAGALHPLRRRQTKHHHHLEAALDQSQPMPNPRETE